LDTSFFPAYRFSDRLALCLVYDDFSDFYKMLDIIELFNNNKERLDSLDIDHGYSNMHFDQECGQIVIEIKL
jgi:hypothetical protein